MPVVCDRNKVRFQEILATEQRALNYGNQQFPIHATRCFLQLHPLDTVYIKTNRQV